MITLRAVFAGRRALADESGSMAIIAAIGLTLILLSAGMAVDYGRLLYTRRITSAALDAAVLAGARALQLKPDDQSAAVAAAQAYYKNNVTSRLDLLDDSVGFAVADNGTAIAASGSAHLATTVLAAVGFDKLTVVSDVAAALPKAKIGVGSTGEQTPEVAVMLDVTGSMCDDGVGPCTGGTKLTGLKVAAQTLVDTVVATDQSKYTSRVALVPLMRVRVAADDDGGQLMKKLTNLNQNWTGWYKMCVQGAGQRRQRGQRQLVLPEVSDDQVHELGHLPLRHRPLDNDTWTIDTTDAAPGSNAWLNAHDGGRMPMSWDSSEMVATMLGKTSTDPAEFWKTTAIPAAVPTWRRATSSCPCRATSRP